jgi:hypothetical protein
MGCSFIGMWVNKINHCFIRKNSNTVKTFAYTVVSLDESRVLGCVYINPPEDKDTDAVVVMWVRQIEFDKGYDHVLFKTVSEWLEET